MSHFNILEHTENVTAIDSRKNGKLKKTYKCDMCSALIVRGKRCKACSYEAVLKQGRTQ